MKLLKGSTFAHPVVAPFLDDVEENRFHLTQFVVNSDGTHYHISAEFELHNSGLLSYLKKNKACFALLMEARNFYYRKLHSPLPAKHNFSIKGELVSGYVDCTPLVVATEDISDYRLSDFNSDYRDITISVRRGDVLAISDGRTFLADKNYDSLKKLSSIMQVLQDDKVLPGCMDVSLDTDKITIYVCQEDHAKYSSLSKLPEGSPALLQMVAVPALQEAIVYLRNAGDSGGQRRWEYALKKRLEAMKLSIDGSTSCDIACQLLNGSLQNALSDLDRLISGEE